MEIPIQELILNGNPIKLALDANAIELIHKKVGINLFDTATWERPRGLFADFDAQKCTAMIWAMAQREQPKMTIEQVSHMYGLREIPTIVEVISKLVVESMPEVALPDRPQMVGEDGGTDSGQSADSISASPTGK
jgi:hypothetical protein